MSVVRSGRVRTGAGSGAVEFVRPDFDELVKGHGYDVVWEKAAVCPNRPRDGMSPNAHDPNCAFCEGRGIVYFSPCSARMVVQSAKLSQQFYAQGRWDRGAVIVTAPPGFAISWWDRITLVSGVARFTELVTRQRDVPDYLKYDALDVEYASWVDRNGSLAQLPTELMSVTNNRVTWAGVGGPDVGSKYSVAYCYHPRYVLLEMLHQHRYSPQGGKPRPFPLQAVGILDFMVRDESRDQVALEGAEDVLSVTR